MNKYYSLKKIEQKGAIYNVIIGERSNGKTYAVCEKEIKAYFKDGSRLALIRRFKEDLTPRNIGELLTPHVELIKKLSKGRFNSVRYYNREFWLVCRDDKGAVIDQSETSIIKCFSLNTWESAKGADNGFFKYILFDEFLTRAYYLKDEFVIFTQLLSSIIRNRDGTIIYMIANTVNKYCPYFKEMGLSHIEQMPQGTIDVYKYNNNGLTVAVEYCATSGASKAVSKYFAFDNPRLDMITSGKWEIACYPHCPVEYDKSDIIQHAFISFNDNLIHGEIVCHDDKHNKHLFVFMYQQTKPVNLDNVEVLYTDYADSNILHCTNAGQIPTKAHAMFIDLIRQHNDFYADNECGEIVRNWKIANGLMIAK